MRVKKKRIITLKVLIFNKNDTFTYQQLNFNEDPKFRAMSDFFNITLPEHNLWEEKEVPGTYKGITEGYFLLLNPLPPGNHTLYYEAAD